MTKDMVHETGAKIKLKKANMVSKRECDVLHQVANRNTGFWTSMFWASEGKYNSEVFLLLHTASNYTCLYLTNRRDAIKIINIHILLTLLRLDTGTIINSCTVPGWVF